MDLKMPTEVVTLPSQGVLYDENNILSKGEVEIKYMTAKEEDILTNMNYIKDGTVFEKLLRSILVTPIDISTLISGDKDAILIAARILGYGKFYEVENRKGNGYDKIDLSTLKDKNVDLTNQIVPGKNEFSWVCPSNGYNATFKILTHKDEKDIESEIKGMQKIDPEGNYEISTRLKYILVSVNGNYEKSYIRNFVDNYMRASDGKDLRDNYKRTAPCTELKYYPDHAKEGIEFGLGINFFWVNLGI